LLSPCLFNIFLEQITTEALESFEGNVRIGGRSINNLPFADGTDLIAGSMKELAELTERLDKSASAFEMEISAEKSKIMVTPATNDNNTNILITVNGSKPQSVKSFKYLGSNVAEDGTAVQEVKIRLAIATQHLSKLKKIWSSKNISTKTKMSLVRSMVISTALYCCKSWTLTANLEKRIAAFEMRCFHRLLQIPYTAHRNQHLGKTTGRLHDWRIRTADTNRQTPKITVVWARIQTHGLSREHHNARIVIR